MQADMIIKNAKIYTSDAEKPLASALVVKDGKFAYVGDEAGLADFEGEVSDLGGRFVMPGIIDSHVHVTTGVGFEYADLGLRFEPDGKQAALDFMAAYIKDNPGLNRYRFFLERKYLKGEPLTMAELDEICPDAEIVVLEGEVHSNWANSKVYELHDITDETPDPVPGLAYYVRDENGHLTGNSFESASWVFVFDSLKDLTRDQIEAAVTRWIDFCETDGVSAVFDAGFPMHNWLHERIYDVLADLDRQGRLHTYIDGCYVLTVPRMKEEALAELKRFSEKYDTEHLKVHTLKIFMDGTMKIETAAQVRPYEDTGERGYTCFEADELAGIIVELNKMGFDLHTHTVGERASRVVLDAVEQAREQLGDDYRVKVTCAHLEMQCDEDIPRFAELGVIANFTPWWNASIPALNAPILGVERANNQLRCKTLWDTGALVTWSSDNVAYGDFTTWRPMLGMEVGMARQITEKTVAPEYNRNGMVYPPADERMGIDEMLVGYTIRGARQLGIEDRKGSITPGKDADFLVFDEDLTTAEHEGFSQNRPCDVYFSGKKMN